MASRCIKCFNPNASGGDLANWERKGIIPDLKLLHKVERFLIQNCKQCNSHFIYNGKIFDECVESHIPALLKWPDSLKFYHTNREIIQPIFKNKIFDTLFSGLFEIKLSNRVEHAIIIAYDKLISNTHYDPLKPIPNNATIRYLRSNSPDETRDKTISKYLIKHDQHINS